MDRLAIGLAFLAFILAVRWCRHHLLTLIPKEQHETPANPLRADRPRPVSAFHTGARVVAVRSLPGRNARLVDRLERRRAEIYPFLACGIPAAELDTAHRVEPEGAA